MVWFRRSNVRLTRLVSALLLLVALAPSLSQMLSAWQHESAPWSVVCSAPSGAPGVPGDMPGTVGDHCPMCLSQAQAWHTGTQWSLWGLLPAVAVLVPLLFLWAPRPLPAWSAARPRAPPAFA